MKKVLFGQTARSVREANRASIVVIFAASVLLLPVTCCRAQVNTPSIQYSATATTQGPSVTGLTVTSGATQSGVNPTATVGTSTYVDNWAAVESQTAGATAIVTATVSPDTPATEAALTWSGGAAVSGTNLERAVSLASSSINKVVASLGSSKLRLYIWVVWGSYEIRLGGTTDSGQQSQILGDKPMLPGYWLSTLGGGNQCGPISVYSTSHFTYYPDAVAGALTQGICTLSPPGIGKVLAQNGCQMSRQVSIAFGRDTVWSPPSAYFNDNSESLALDLDPSSDDKIYDADCPVSPTGGTTWQTAETYDQFSAIAWVNLGAWYRVCEPVSSYYEVQVDKTKTAPLVENIVALGTIPSIPTAAQSRR